MPPEDDTMAAPKGKEMSATGVVPLRNAEGDLPSRKTPRYRIQETPNHPTSLDFSLLDTPEECFPHLRRCQSSRRVLFTYSRLRRGLQLLGAPTLFTPWIRSADVGILPRI